MKKVYQSFISILLVFSLLASMTLTSFATAKNNKVGDKVTLYEDHETIVEMYPMPKNPRSCRRSASSECGQLY